MSVQVLSLSAPVNGSWSATNPIEVPGAASSLTFAVTNKHDRVAYRAKNETDKPHYVYVAVHRLVQCTFHPRVPPLYADGSEIGESWMSLMPGEERLMTFQTGGGKSWPVSVPLTLFKRSGSRLYLRASGLALVGWTSGLELRPAGENFGPLDVITEEEILDVQLTFGGV